MSLIPMPYRIGAAVLLLIGVLGFAYFEGVDSERERFNLFKEQVRKAGEEQEIAFEQKIKEQKEITDAAAKRYDQGVSTIRAEYQRRLRDSARAGGSEVPIIPATSSDVDAGTGNDVPAAAGAKTCENLAEDAAITTYQLIELQNWVRDQSAQ